MKHKGFVFMALLMLLAVNTSYVWESWLGGLALPAFGIIVAR